MLNKLFGNSKETTKGEGKPLQVKHEILNSLLNKNLSIDEEEVLFGCGCFWGAEKAFWRLPGIVTTSVGYAGGAIENPTYQQVCSGKTGHTEVVRVVWNKNIIDISDLLKLFWECHDPTQGNRQGNDQGSQYRSAIYTYKLLHSKKAEASLYSYQKSLKDKGYGNITTELNNNIKYYFAESYHQQYLAKKGARPYCSAMPTNVRLIDFEGADFKLSKRIWENYDWDTNHCVLRSDNNPIVI